MTKKIIMENLSCTGCTSKIEIEIKKLDYVKNATFNFSIQTMLLDVTENFDDYESTMEIKRIVDSIETGIITYLSVSKPGMM